MYYVLLSWTDYRKLLAGSPRTKYFSKETKAQRNAWQQDEIIPVRSEQEARALVWEFNSLCEADWTPNQSPEDREFYSRQAKRSREAIDQARKFAESASRLGY